MPFIGCTDLASLFFKNQNPFGLQAVTYFFQHLLQTYIRIGFAHADSNDLIGHDFAENDIIFSQIMADIRIDIYGHRKAVILPLPGNERRPREQVLPGLAITARRRIKTVAAQLAIDAVLTRRIEAGQDLIALFTDPAIGIGKAIALLHVFINIDQFIRIRSDNGYFFIELIKFFLIEDQAVADIDSLSILLFIHFIQAFPQKHHDLIEILALRPLSHGVL